MPDLTKYVKQIHESEDTTLFLEAVDSAQIGALRSAYIMIWLACAVSLKRRFREARKFDGNAGVISGEIEKKENAHQAVDKFILEKAKEYGFLKETSATVLWHIYEMRCIYGHPYEEAPSEEQVIHAASEVTKHVLSKPLKLQYGYVEQLFVGLLEKREFLDDHVKAVNSFVDEILPRIDGNIYCWLLEKYWKKLEEIYDDRSMGVFVRRGLYFTRYFLRKVGTNVFSKREWHDKVMQFPKVLIRILGTSPLFEEVGINAQNSIVSAIFTETETRPSVLRYLEHLGRKESLTKRQRDRFEEQIWQMGSEELRSSGLGTETCFLKIIESLKTHDWYKQNPIIDLIETNGPEQVETLDADKQIELGRNILQAADGRANSAVSFIEEMTKDKNPWPLFMVNGIALECFVNEKNQIRIKTECLDIVFKVIDTLKLGDRKKILEDIVGSIDRGEVKSARGFRERRSEALDLLKTYKWKKTLKIALEGAKF